MISDELNIKITSFSLVRSYGFVFLCCSRRFALALWKKSISVLFAFSFRQLAMCCVTDANEFFGNNETVVDFWRSSSFWGRLTYIIVGRLPLQFEHIRREMHYVSSYRPIKPSHKEFTVDARLTAAQSGRNDFVIFISIAVLFGLKSIVYEFVMLCVHTTPMRAHMCVCLCAVLSTNVSSHIAL